MTIKGKTSKLRFNGKTYEIGEPLSGLSEKEEAQLVEDGIAEYVVEPAAKKAAESIITNMNAKDAVAFVQSIEDIVELNKLGMEETEGKNRVTVVKAISERIAELEASDGKEPNKEDKPEEKTTKDGHDNEGSGNEDTGDNVNLHLNPEDVIVR